MGPTPVCHCVRGTAVRSIGSRPLQKSWAFGRKTLCVLGASGLLAVSILGDERMLSGTIGRVQSPRIIRIGGGVAGEVAETLAQLGLSRPLIVTDKGVR